MAANLVTVSVTVPETAVSELYSFVSELTADGSSNGKLSNGKAATKWGFGKKAVQNAYWGGVSDVWRPFLEELALRPDEWVEWQELCKAIKRTPRQASGMLGAAERRCKQRPPYEKSVEDGMHYFRMRADVADIINELAEKE